VQAPDTVLIDLSPAPEEILAGMSPKWRYNVRLAARKGVSLRRAGTEKLPVFYALLGETARRDGIAIHRYYDLFGIPPLRGPRPPHGGALPL
jgi:lipid II:glycine glycyltransferase (peptidoglycan interpeptide bridge formation enzyme)